MSRHTDQTPHTKRMPMLKRMAMPEGPVPILWSDPQTISRAFETREGENSMQSAAAYRNFLHYTQDVIAASEHYPGGMTGLIGHREDITIRLVRLLGVRAAASSLKSAVRASQAV